MGSSPVCQQRRNSNVNLWQVQDRKGIASMGSEEARVVRDWIESGDKVRRILATNGSKVIKKACDNISLRELARKTGLSPTYLSQVATKKIVISPEAFLKVQGVVNEVL